MRHTLDHHFSHDKQGAVASGSTDSTQFKRGPSYDKALLPKPSGDLIDASDQFDIIKNPYDRMEYVHLTDQLIHRLEGHDDNPRPDFVIFLDKSARPVSWLTKELWTTLAREPGTKFEDGIVPEIPQFLYLNIDSKHMYDRSDLPGLRSLFTEQKVDDINNVWDMDTYFKDKHILIVDEIAVTHATEVKAKAYLELAFPEAKSVSTFTWMDQAAVTNYGGYGEKPEFDIDTMRFKSAGNESKVAPPLTNNLRWYKDRSDKRGLSIVQKRAFDDGRGVIDRDAAYPEELQKSIESSRTRHGYQWLAVGPNKVTAETKQVRAEMKLIAQEIKNGSLPYWPAGKRGDAVERLGMSGLSPFEFREFNGWFKEKWWHTWGDALTYIGEKRPRRLSTQRLGAKALELVKRLHLDQY